MLRRIPPKNMEVPRALPVGLHAEMCRVGLILCADKSEEQIKLLQLDKSGIRVAAYLTELPPRKLLQKKLHEAILLARARLEGKNGEQERIENKPR